MQRMGMMPSIVPVGMGIKSVGNNPLMNLPSGLTRQDQARLIQSHAENFAAKAKEMGLSASVEHSGSKAGPSSYVTVLDPITGAKFESPFRFSGHSKGPKESQFVYNVGDDFSNELGALEKMALSIPKAERDAIQSARQAKMIEDLSMQEKERIFSQGRRAVQSAMQEANLQQTPYTKAFSNSGKYIRANQSPYPQQAALELAQQRAALPVSQGGLGLPASNTAEQRAAAMGFNTDAYHGTTTNIKPTFNLDYSGSNAVDYGQKNIFASSDPQLASDYALKGLSRNQAEAIMQKKDYDWYKSKVIPKDILDAFVKDAVEYGVAEGGGANVLPLLMRGNIFPYEAYGGRFSSEIPKALFGRDLSNADIAAINNVVDNPTFKKINPSTVYAIKNPENIRSRFAAFDPFRRSAAIAATMGVAAPDLLASPIDEEELRRLQSGLLYAP
jgi:hypothetical protein